MMSVTDGARHRVGEVARLTGVSIRTLHHYDHLGLLSPSGRSDAGYRLYDDADLLRLQQILTLRYLGFQLARIGELLGRPDFDVAASLRIQRRIMRRRIGELRRIDTALEGLLTHRRATGEWGWQLVVGASAAARQGLDRKDDEMADYYTPDEMKAAMAEVGAGISPEEIERIEAAWATLLAEVRAARVAGVDPASPQAQALAARWNAQTQELHAYYAGDPTLWNTIGNNYATGAYSEVPQAPTMDDFAFIAAATKAGPGE